MFPGHMTRGGDVVQLGEFFDDSLNEGCNLVESSWF